MYAINKAKAIYRSNAPSLTDQAAYKDTDLNIVIPRYLTTGHAPGQVKPGEFMDLSEVPQDLRGLIDESRRINQYRQQLPEELRDIPTEQLIYMSPEEMRRHIEGVRERNKPPESPKPELKKGDNIAEVKPPKKE